MPRAKNGDTVSVHYTGKLEDGEVFDSSAGGEPLEFTLGVGEVIPGFERTVLGMTPGETTTTTIQAEEAYGHHREEMVMVVERTQIPGDLDPQVGQMIRITQPDGNAIDVKVTKATGAHLTLDANHPLAGKTLVFEIHLVSIK